MQEVLEADTPGTRSKASNPIVRFVTDAVRFYFEFHRACDQGQQDVTFAKQRIDVIFLHAVKRRVDNPSVIDHQGDMAERSP